MRRLSIGLLGGTLVLAACGNTNPDATGDTTAPVETDAPAAVDTPAEEPADTPTTTQAPAPTTTESAPAAEPEPADDPPVDDEPAPTTTLAPEPEPAPLGGRELGQALRPESATAANPLPDLLVDDIRREEKANLANAVPSNRALLIWAWAPH